MGRHKFRLWQSIFGYGEEDGDLLKDTLLGHVADGRFKEKEPGEGVRRFEVVIEDFTGANGHTGRVVMGWAFEDGADRPHFVTARPITD